MRILGAGLSGLAAAVTLALAGREVEVIEARRDSGARFHGDIQALENWSRGSRFLDRMESWGLTTRGLWTRPVHEVDLLFGNRRRRVVSKTAAADLVRRGVDPGTLDQTLKRRAVELGVTIRYGATEAPDRCHIVATGPRRASGFVYGDVFKTDERTRTALSFSERASPGAYGYLATAGGHGVLASVIVRPGANPARCLNETRRIFDHAFPDLPRRRLRRFGGAGCFALPRSYSVLGRFYAGEAAGLQDALWGFGMRQAILSGRLAALAVLGEIDYDEELRRQILPQMVTTLVSRAGLDRLGPRATELLLHAWVLSQRILGDGLPFLRRLYGGRGLRHSVQGLARRTLIDAEHAHPALGMRWLPLDRAGA